MGELVGLVQIRPWGSRSASGQRPGEGPALPVVCPESALTGVAGRFSPAPLCSLSGFEFPAFFPVSVWLITSVSRLDLGVRGWPQPRWAKLCRLLWGQGPGPWRETSSTSVGRHPRLSFPDHDVFEHASSFAFISV